MSQHYKLSLAYILNSPTSDTPTTVNPPPDDIMWTTLSSSHTQPNPKFHLQQQKHSPQSVHVQSNFTPTPTQKTPIIFHQSNFPNTNQFTTTRIQPILMAKSPPHPIKIRFNATPSLYEENKSFLENNNANYNNSYTTNNPYKNHTTNNPYKNHFYNRKNSHIQKRFKKQTSSSFTNPYPTSYSSRYTKPSGNVANPSTISINIHKNSLNHNTFQESLESIIFNQSNEDQQMPDTNSKTIQHHKTDVLIKNMTHHIEKERSKRYNAMLILNELLPNHALALRNSLSSQETAQCLYDFDSKIMKCKPVNSKLTHRVIKHQPNKGCYVTGQWSNEENNLFLKGILSSFVIYLKK